MPLIVWAHPRGSAIEAKGGNNSLHTVDYAARTASELGADVVKVNFPDPKKRTSAKTEYGRGLLQPTGDRCGRAVRQQDVGSHLRRREGR